MSNPPMSVNTTDVRVKYDCKPEIRQVHLVIGQHRFSGSAICVTMQGGGGGRIDFVLHMAA